MSDITEDPLETLIRGSAEPPKVAYPSRSMAMSAGRKKSKTEDEDLENLILGNTPTSASNVPTTVQAVQEKPPMVRQIIGNVLQKGFEAKQALPGFLASVADIPLSLPEFAAGTVAYPVARGLGGTDTQAQQFKTNFAEPFSYLKLGKSTGIEKTPAYQQSLPTKTMEFIGENINKGVTWIAEKTGLSPYDVQATVDALMLASPVIKSKVIPQVAETASKVGEAIKEKLPTVTIERQAPIGGQTGMQSGGAAATPNATMVQQALSVATPELQQMLKDIPVQQIHVPTFQRHIEADSLYFPVRLTKGQATGDLAQLSKEQNMRGKNPQYADRFKEQNQTLIDNLQEARTRAAPDVFGTKTIENSQGVIDAYKQLDSDLTKVIDQNYQNLRDAAGGQFPVDAPVLLQNIQAKLKEKLLSNEAPKGQLGELKRLAKDKSMTFEDYLSLRRNLGEIARTAKDGNERKAASFMIEELEKLPLQKEAASLKPLADVARSSARDRFQMLEKDPAFKAAVNDSVPADKFIDKFVVNGVNKNIETMVNHLGKDSPARQHMAAGTINWLSDKAGIYGEQANFSQAGFNKALKKLDDVNNLPIIFDAETAGKLKTIGNVAGYTQFQPRGSFVNNSNSTVAAMAANAAEQAANIIGGGKFGLPIGTMVRNKAQEIKAGQQAKKDLELGAGTKQTGKNQINNLNNP